MSWGASRRWCIPRSCCAHRFLPPRRIRAPCSRAWPFWPRPPLLSFTRLPQWTCRLDDGCCSRASAAPCAPQDNDAYHDIETDATSGAGRRMMARASRATIMLAALAIYFGFRGAIAARVGNPKDMGEYVGYKALFLALTLVMQLSLHRLWWDGCGVLTQEVCTDQKFQFIFIALVAVLPGLYCLWVSWSLFDALKDNIEHVLYRAGYDQVCTPHASALCALVSFALCAHTWCQRTCGPLHVHTHRLPAHASRCA